ncbi:MAG TPA: hypothetical protein VKW06_10570 [Candidatus Angelobacter sp.]|nr:hypothetical protein [Candidatus Angelobacter sp.]
MADTPAEQRTCIACSEPATFTVNVVGYLLRVTPKVSKSSTAVGVCDRCADPKSASYEKLKRAMAVIVFMVRNDLRSLATSSGAQPSADRKTAAAGGE